MACLGFLLNKTANIYSVDRTSTTDSGQPTETLTLDRTVKVYFSPNVRNVYKLFDAGQIKVGAYSCFSGKQITEDEIVEIDNVKYIVTGVVEAAYKRHIFGYISYLERYRH